MSYNLKCCSFYPNNFDASALPANQSGFQSKSVIFVTSIPIPEAPMGRGWADIHMVKGVFVRFGFDAIRISQIQRQVKNKATKNAS